MIARAETLSGEGLSLRPMTLEDAPLIARASETDIPDWTFVPRSASVDRARDWIGWNLVAEQEGHAIRFVIEVDGTPCGSIGAQHPYVFDPGVIETYYFVMPEARRRGLATRSLLAMDDWLAATVPALRRIQLHVIPENPGSEKVAERAGYGREGLVANKIPAINGFAIRDAYLFGKPIGRPAVCS